MPGSVPNRLLAPSGVLSCNHLQPKTLYTTLIPETKEPHAHSQPLKCLPWRLLRGRSAHPQISSRRLEKGNQGTCQWSLTDSMLSYVLSAAAFIISVSYHSSLLTPKSFLHLLNQITQSAQLNTEINKTTIRKEMNLRTSCSGVIYPIVASIEMRPCLSSVWRRRLKFSTLPSAVNLNKQD